MIYSDDEIAAYLSDAELLLQDFWGATDNDERSTLYVELADILKPLAEPENSTPVAAYFMGSVAESLARQLDKHPRHSADRMRLFYEAADYYHIAGALAPYDEDAALVAKYSLGMLYADNLVVVPNGRDPNKEAFTMLKEAAEAGLADASVMLSIMYKTGRGTEQNDERALYWMERADEHKAELNSRALDVLNEQLPDMRLTASVASEVQQAFQNLRRPLSPRGALEVRARLAGGPH